MNYITDEQMRQAAHAIMAIKAGEPSPDDWTEYVAEAADVSYEDADRIIQALLSNSSPCWLCGSSDNDHLIVFVPDQGIYAHERELD